MQEELNSGKDQQAAVCSWQIGEAGTRMQNAVCRQSETVLFLLSYIFTNCQLLTVFHLPLSQLK